MLNSSEKTFIERGFRTLDQMENDTDIAICEMPNNEYALFSGAELAAAIIEIIDEYHF